MVGLIIFIIIALAIVLIGLLLFVLLGGSEASAKKPDLPSPPKLTMAAATKKKLIFEDAMRVAQHPNSPTDKLDATITIVAEKFPFPKKRGIAISKEVSPWFEFVLLVVNHRHTNPKLIARVIHNLSKANPDYREEIAKFEAIDMATKKR